MDQKSCHMHYRNYDYEGFIKSDEDSGKKVVSVERESIHSKENARRNNVQIT